VGHHLEFSLVALGVGAMAKRSVAKFTAMQLAGVIRARRRLTLTSRRD
jgi:hypothetical protein